MRFKKNNSEEYWRIIIGPWLLIFLAVIYDRWKILENVLNEHKVTDVIVSKEKFVTMKYLTWNILFFRSKAIIGI